MFNSWVRKIPWRREWQPAPVFLPEFHGQRSLSGYSLCKPPPQHTKISPYYTLEGVGLSKGKLAKIYLTEMKLPFVFRVKNVRCQNMPEFTSVRFL